MKPSEDTSKLELQRIQKRDQLAAMGIDPYGLRYDDTESAVSTKARCVDDDDTQKARCAGRIVLLRDIGKLMFLTIRDVTGTIQIGLSKKMIAGQWDLAKLLELGDTIGCQGQLGKTRTGEITIWGEEDGLTFLSKCLSQPPE
ncbi:MAG: lysine--tRNA ligase, partial [Planctomycetes bacterium]|nr:lysine--tRNA ligase [Planctomycetota bacterium]